MKRILVLIVAFALTLSLFGCGKTNSTISDFTGEVSSNGGFMIEKGEYIYYVNGSESSTAENKFGSVLKGGIARTKKSEIGKENAKSEIVIPEIVYSSYLTSGSGIYIFGDYFYYPTPCAEKNKDGVVRNTEVEFMRTKFDGTGAKVIANIPSNAAPYRFIEIDGTVYLAVYATNEDSKYVITIYNADTQKKVMESSEISSYAFSSDIDYEYVYYSTPIINEVLDEPESFNAVRRLKLDGSEDVEILNGQGKTSDPVDGIGTEGVVFSIVRNTGDLLILTETSITSSTVFYLGIETKNITSVEVSGKKATAVNYSRFVVLDNGTTTAGLIFNTTSIFISLDCIIYFDSTYGIVKYDYTKALTANWGRTKIYYDEQLFTLSFLNIQDNGNAIFLDSSGFYFSFNLSDFINLETGAISTAEGKLKQLNFVPSITTWYSPEMVGNYIVTLVVTEPYNGYLFAFDTTVTDGMDDDEIEEYSEEINKQDRDHILSIKSKLIGIMSQTDIDTFDTYLDENYPLDDEE